MNKSLIATAALALASWLGFCGPALAGDSNPMPAECQKLVQELVENIRVVGWIGIQMHNNEDASMTIEHVEPDSPAAKAGLQKGDRIIARNGLAYDKANKEKHWTEHRRSRAGDKVVFTIVRKGETRDVEITLGKIPHSFLATIIGYEVMGMAGLELED